MRLLRGILVQQIPLPSLALPVTLLWNLRRSGGLWRRKEKRDRPWGRWQGQGRRRACKAGEIRVLGAKGVSETPSVPPGRTQKVPLRPHLTKTRVLLFQPLLGGSLEDASTSPDSAPDVP